MSATSAPTLRKLPEGMTLRVISPKKRSTSPKISEKADPKRASGAWVAFSTSSRPIFCYRTARCWRVRVQMRTLAFGVVPRGNCGSNGGIVCLLLTQVVVWIWVVLLC